MIDSDTDQISSQTLKTWLSNWKNNVWEVVEKPKTLSENIDLLTFADHLRIQDEKRQAYVENHPLVKKMMNIFAGARLDDIVTNMN